MAKKINMWQVAAVVFGVLFLLSIFNVFSFSGSTTKITGNAVSYINENLLSQQGVEATVVSSEKTNGVIRTTLNIDGQIQDVYVVYMKGQKYRIQIASGHSVYLSSISKVFYT